MNHKTLDFYSEGVTLSKFIHEGRPTTTKPTFDALPSLTSSSTFYECSRGRLCQPQDSPHSPLTRLGVIISYSLCLERKITLPSIQESFRPTFTPGQVTKQYGAYMGQSQDRQESSILSQSVEYCPRYKHQSTA